MRQHLAMVAGILVTMLCALAYEASLTAQIVYESPQARETTVSVDQGSGGDYIITIIPGEDGFGNRVILSDSVHSNMITIGCDGRCDELKKIEASSDTMSIELFDETSGVMKRFEVNPN